MRRVGCLLAVAAVSMAWAAPASAGDHGKFYATKDFASFCPDWVDHVGTGGNVAAYTKAFCGNYYGDFDRTTIASWLTACPAYTVRLNIVPRDGTNTCADRVYKVTTWFAQSDWVEADGNWDLSPQWGWVDYGGSGNFNPHAFNWDKAVGAPTKWYAETYYTDTDNIPGTGDEVLDAVNSVPWLDRNGNTTGNPWQGASSPSPSHLEGLHFLGDLNTGGDGYRSNSQNIVPAGPDVYHGVALDAAVIADLVTPGNHCQGIRIGLGADFDDWSNCWTYTREAFDLTPGSEYDYRPYLQLLYPGDADTDGDVDLADLSTLAFHWDTLTGAAWDMGDFDEDGYVDLADLSTLAFYWDWAHGDDCTAPGIPEPAACLLFGVGAPWLLRRRRA